jgi:hypothetical protein
MRSENPDENAAAFLAQIDAIKATDVSEERLKAFASEDEFNGVAVDTNAVGLERHRLE